MALSLAGTVPKLAMKPFTVLFVTQTDVFH
jgi:hypothetical protein